MDLLFSARDFFTRRLRARSKSPLDGRRCSIGGQAIAHYDRADLRRDIDRSLRNHPRRTHSAYHFDPSLAGHNIPAMAIARRAEAGSCRERALEFLAKPARIQFANASVTVERHPDPV